MIKGADILVTGGTGYFGEAFVRALLAKGARRICVFSRGEYRQAQMRAALEDNERLRWFIGDVRDRERLRRAMTGVEIVVHAAALKRIEVVEYNVHEAVSTNVRGTENVVQAAIDAGVHKVVFLSTDKAVEPLNAYGMTKALAEKIVMSAHHQAGPDGPKFAVTRYGNVSGSTGSVIPTWRSLLRGGCRELPVTDPNCTRYWMSQQEAVDLVMGAVETAVSGELVIPTLPAYRLGDLAEAMGGEMRIVGMRPGEKLHESMKHGETSETARRMSVAELRARLAEVA